jgi:DNA-binding transcriptional regulator YbjK
MPTTRERALQAAVEVLGAEGVRALSHARVDAAAGLPTGSTSNWFRTRRALLAGIVDWIAESERAGFAASDLPVASGEDGLIDGLSTLIELLTDRFAVRTRARYALFFELSSDGELGPVLRAQRQEFERWTEHLVSAAGIPDASSTTRAIMALGDGLILHRLTVDPGLAVRPPIERTVRALRASGGAGAAVG